MCAGQICRFPKAVLPVEIWTIDWMAARDLAHDLSILKPVTRELCAEVEISLTLCRVSMVYYIGYLNA